MKEDMTIGEVRELNEADGLSSWTFGISRSNFHISVEGLRMPEEDNAAVALCFTVMRPEGDRTEEAIAVPADRWLDGFVYAVHRLVVAIEPYVQKHEDERVVH